MNGVGILLLISGGIFVYRYIKSAQVGTERSNAGLFLCVGIIQLIAGFVFIAR